MPELTPQQRLAVESAGDTLVMAGAGAGKTRTLIARCLAHALDTEQPVALDRILMVTFTEAAAAEMRQRIARELEQRAEEFSTTAATQEQRDWIDQQLALLDAAPISTLHSFCLRLVRENFHTLGLDPQLAVLDEANAETLAAESLDAVFNRHYAGAEPSSSAVQQLILALGRGADLPIRRLVRRLHRYAQTLPAPESWFAEQLRQSEQSEPNHWRAWLLAGVNEWREYWKTVLDSDGGDTPPARRCRGILLQLGAAPADATEPHQTRPRAYGSGSGTGILPVQKNAPRGLDAPGRNDAPLDRRDACPTSAREQSAAALKLLLDLFDGEFAADRAGKTFRKDFKRMFDDARFLLSLAEVRAGRDPLAEDWEWTRGHLRTLLELAREFAAEFAAAKRELGALDFADLEQFALRLLCDEAGRPTPLAEHWRARFDLVLVDEYQDINAAQDKIIAALGRTGAAANRFLVGDVKQSIYRFRLADPRIFQGYAAAWQQPGAAGRVVPLAENFRSHEAILGFVNPLFARLMRAEIGGVEYDESARLQFGAPTKRVEFSAAHDSPRVEFHLLLQAKKQTAPDGDEDAAEADLSRAETEARFIAHQLRTLHGTPVIWDEPTKSRRAVRWSDMVILLRSPRSHAESYAKIFSRAGIPLVAPRGGFFEELEVTDLLSLLMLLDNPLQDVPLLAVLRSPLVGLTLDELASVRLAQRRGPLWHALRAFLRIGGESRTESSRHPSPSEDTPHPAFGHPLPSSDEGRGQGEGCRSFTTQSKVSSFLDAFTRWRRIARRAALSECLETILDETHYEDWLLAQPRGAQRQANVRRLLALARRFDQSQRQGLFRFLQHIESRRRAEAEAEPAAVESGDAVRLMSYHQSKGLEFPIVAVAGLGGKFNFEDLRQSIILDEEFGLCPHVKPPHRQRSYPSLPWWLAARRQKRELLGEEIRLLYVAMTRAQEKLILLGTATESRADKWPATPVEKLSVPQIVEAGSCLDWLAALLPTLTGAGDWHRADGQNARLRWQIHGEVAPLKDTVEKVSPLENSVVAPEKIAALAARLDWRYPHAAAIHEPAKVSVTALRRRLVDEADEEAGQFFAPKSQFTERGSNRSGRGTARSLSAAEIGAAHHRLLEHAAPPTLGDAEALRAEAVRLVRGGVLLAEELAALDFAAIADFWRTDVGQIILQQSGNIHRELPFTARMSVADLQSIRAGFGGGLADGEFFVVQGVVDLAVILPGEIWLVDFKTDDVDAAGLAEKTRAYAPQLQLYALALGRIYARPVTARWLHFLAARRTVALP